MYELSLENRRLMLSNYARAFAELDLAACVDNDILTITDRASGNSKTFSAERLNPTEIERVYEDCHRLWMLGGLMVVKDAK